MKPRLRKLSVVMAEAISDLESEHQPTWASDEMKAAA